MRSFDRAFVAEELEKLVQRLPERIVDDGAFGRFHVDVQITVEHGFARHVKSSAYFEQAKRVEGGL